MIHVCSLARLHETVETCGARYIITLLKNTDQVVRPPVITEKNHLILSMDDIAKPMEGYEAPAAHQIETLIEFATRWDRTAPLVVHCYAGISRSTASIPSTATTDGGTNRPRSGTASDFVTRAARSRCAWPAGRTTGALRG